jgi:hypothetical protein
MRVQKLNPWLYSLGVVLAVMALSGSRAGADVTSDRPGSVTVWPKVIADGTRDTLITLTNTRNEEAYAHCEYVNGLGTCRLSGAYCTLPSSSAVPSVPACPGGTGDVCDLQWQSLDFDVILTRQQPTIWRVSTGRRDDPLQEADAECEPDGQSQNCPGFFLVGQVPAPVQPFAGELRCIQVARDGSALNANGFKGEATIETIAKASIEFPPPAGVPVLSAQISKYSSINIRAVRPPGDDPSILPLNGVVPGTDPYNVYNACPEAVEFTNYSVGAQDLVADSINPTACAVSGCPVTTEITVIPCRADFEREIPTRFTLNIVYHNEFEQPASVERDFQCWTNFTLQQLGFTNVAGSTFQRTRINPSGSGLCIDGNMELINTPCMVDADCVSTLPVTSGVCAPASGVLAIVEEFHDSDVTLAPGSTFIPGTDAANPYGVDANGDGYIGRPGHCRGVDLRTTRCTSDGPGGCTGSGCVNDACPVGRCRVSGAACSNVVGPDCGAGDFCDQCMNDEMRFQPDVVTPIPPMP